MKVEILCFNFTKGIITTSDFVWELRKLERRIRKDIKPKKDASLWFRFPSESTGATGINEIERTLVDLDDSPRNIEHLKECIALSYSVGYEPGVYFS